MKIDKKSQYLVFGLIIGIIAAFLVSVISTYTGENFNIIGSYSLYALESSKLAEKKLFYLDQSAGYALEESIYKLAEYGGISYHNFYDEEGFIETTCSSYKGANEWHLIKRTEDGYETTECFDEAKLGDNLIYIFDEIFNENLEGNPYNLETENYDYQVKQTEGGIEMIGIAKEPLVIEIYNG